MEVDGVTVYATCKECGGRIILNEDNEYVCSNCGLVYGFSDAEPSFHDITSRHFSHDPQCYSIGLGSNIFIEGNNAEQWKGSLHNIIRMKKLVKYNIAIRMYKGRASCYRIFKALDIVCRKLNIPEYVKMRAFQLYLKALGLRGGGINYYKIAASALILAVKEHSLFIPPNKIIKTFRSMGHRVNKGDVLKVLLYFKHRLKYHYNMGVRANVNGYIKIILENIFANIEVRKQIKSKLEKLGYGISVNEYKALLYRHAVKIYNSLDKLKIQGKNPYILAAVAIYAANLALLKNKRSRILSQATLARIIGRSESAVREHYDLFFKEVVKHYNIEDCSRTKRER